MSRSLASRFNLALAATGIALGLAAVPVSLDLANGALTVKAIKAFAKNGADDPAGHNAGDDRGGASGNKGGKGGSGRGGKDDGANHK